MCLSRGGHHTYLDLLPFRMAWCDRAALEWQCVESVSNQSCRRIQRWYQKISKNRRRKENLPPTESRGSSDITTQNSQLDESCIESDTIKNEEEDEAAQTSLEFDRDAFVAKLKRNVRGHEDNKDDEGNLIVSYVQLPSWRKAMPDDLSCWF